ncbi:IclR family transcriptional regulator [Microbacterium sp. HD4P20]|uniref:IclR family transcriptional regulator n=1 Tax=Microbacterium sp. HD4P20 TaxID=2864874 RepID=UPI001C63DEE1|nr:IclR family transcriptional regulator [Microbacterium sp. HD4P20]MCP2636336.1 IclR family transcriptional regulator [Microbacterium sp. HD4P20]
MTETATGDASRDGRLTAAGRVLAVLEVFRTRPSPLRMAEISRHAGLSTTTTHRLIHELLDWGAVEVAETGGYQLSTKVLELAAASGDALRLRERALPALLRLHRMLRVLVVHLSIRDGFDTVYVESLRSAHGGVSTNRIGGRMPLHLTATGRVLLAYADDDVQAGFLAQPLEARTRFTTTDPDELRRGFAGIREQQAAMTARQVTENTGAVAAPVFDHQERVVAAVGIVLNLKDHHLEDYLELVRAAASQVTGSLAPPASD